MKIDRYSLSAFRYTITILLLFASMLTFIPLVHAAISEAEARESAHQYCEDQFGYAKEDQDIYDFSPRKGGGWAFGIKALEADGTMKEFIRGELDKNGKLLSLKGRGEITVSEQIQDDLWRNARSYEAMYAFKQKWEQRFTRLSNEKLNELDRNRHFPFKSLVQHNICLPSPMDISYEEAKKKSQEAILKLPGWTQEMLDHLRINLEVYHVPVGSDRPVYQFVYRTASSVMHVEAIVSGADHDAAYDRLKNAEDRIFAKACPWNVNVRIDAQTGEQIGDIFIDIPPTQYSDVEFILWK